MEPSSILILIAIVLLGICVMGGGTMAFCCHGWERGLPFLSIRDLYDELGQLDRRTTERYRDFVGLVNKVTKELQEEARNLPNQILMKDNWTEKDMEAGRMTSTVECQTQNVPTPTPSPAQPIMVVPSPSAAEVVIAMPEE